MSDWKHTGGAERWSPFGAGQRVGPYELDEPIGGGGYGEVWRAHEFEPAGARQTVALKVLTISEIPGGLEGLAHEAHVCRYLDHPNVIRVLGIHRDGQAAFVVMEFVDGPTLQQLQRVLRAHVLRFPPSAVIDVGRGVARALDHAWRAKDRAGTQLSVVHRNLRPAELMIDRSGRVKVGGFGMAKLAGDGSRTKTGVLKGTPAYMAPERWHGDRNFRPGTDLFSLGVVMWEMATRKKFFPKQNLKAMSEVIQNRPVDEEALYADRAVPGLGRVLLRMLARDPDERCQDAGEIVTELGALRDRTSPAGDLEQLVWLSARLRKIEPKKTPGQLPPAPDRAWPAIVEIVQGARTARPEEDSNFWDDGEWGDLRE